MARRARARSIVFLLLYLKLYGLHARSKGPSIWRGGATYFWPNACVAVSTAAMKSRHGAVATISLRVHRRIIP